MALIFFNYRESYAILFLPIFLKSKSWFWPIKSKNELAMACFPEAATKFYFVKSLLMAPELDLTSMFCCFWSSFGF